VCKPKSYLRIHHRAPIGHVTGVRFVPLLLVRALIGFAAFTITAIPS